MRNSDNECFKWSVLAALHPKRYADHPKRVSQYRQYERDLNFSGLAFPLAPKDIPNFEKLNKISINLFSFLDKDGKLRFPYYISSSKFEREIDLLYFDNHYAWIKDFSKLMSDISKGHYKKLFCKKCFAHFRYEAPYETHIKYCQPYGLFKQIVTMPPPGTTVKFQNVKCLLSSPIVIYADFESILKPCQEKRGEKTEFTQEHVPCSVGVKILCANPKNKFAYT